MTKCRKKKLVVKLLVEAKSKQTRRIKAVPALLSSRNDAHPGVSGCHMCELYSMVHLTYSSVGTCTRVLHYSGIPMDMPDRHCTLGLALDRDVLVSAMECWSAMESMEWQTESSLLLVSWVRTICVHVYTRVLGYR